MFNLRNKAAASRPFGQATYRLARHGAYAVNPLANCPMMTLDRAEAYADDMRLAGYDVLVINMGYV